ncbi:MAG: rhodanese-like domain-containing protein [Clostridiales bacterium]|nr:rhodanese-like domain-containing protein [Clostridiales bacterium]
MKKLTLLAALLALAIGLAACTPAAPTATPATTVAPAATEAPATQAPSAQPAAKAEYRQLTAEQAKARMDSGDEVIILDVRTPEEYAQGHIPGAVLLPVSNIGADTAELLPDKNAEILVYCRSGNRSRQAANALVGMGYTAVYDFGGIGSWPYDIVTE